jgi:hypothetical protein
MIMGIKKSAQPMGFYLGKTAKPQAFLAATIGYQ